MPLPRERKLRPLLRLLIGLTLLGAGFLIGLYGLFALLYNGDCTPHTNCYVYVTVFGRQMNANHVGWVALVIAFAAIVAAAWLLVRRNAARRS